MKRCVNLIVLIALPLVLVAAPKFPFPQNVTYPFGVMPTTVDADKVQAAYEDFMKLYEESGDLARIKWDTESQTVSEGIGYGMMILVYMDNATNNTQTKFDKLWKYYNNFLDAKGLMNWKINGFTGTPSGFDGKNSATDAELDVAIGLMEAYKQWGDEKYLTDAKALIAKIAKEEITSDGYVNAGDSWGPTNNTLNPSYFSTAALQLFKQADSFDWDKVIANSYSCIKKAQNATTGLVQDWCTKEGATAQGREDKYSYDAARTPWRIAWAHSWYGHSDAKEICSKIASWISSNTSNDASKIVDGYKRDGTKIGEYNNATFVGPFACAGLVDATHQTWLDNAYTHLNKLVESKDVYYQQSLKVITLLLLSGNMPDFWTTTGIDRSNGLAAKTVRSSSLAFSGSLNPELSFSINQPGKVTISLYSVSGKQVATLANGSYSTGNHHVSVAHSLNGGTYIVRMRTGDEEMTQRVVITR